MEPLPINLEMKGKGSKGLKGNQKFSKVAESLGQSMRDNVGQATGEAEEGIQDVVEVGEGHLQEPLLRVFLLIMMLLIKQKK